MDVVCGNCARGVPYGSQFCPHCGAAQRGDNGSAPVTSEPATEWAWCEIEWVRSFRGSEFQARPLTPEADQELVRSPMFGWRKLDPPPEADADAREAHEALVRHLVATDWEPVGENGPWYAERFRRPAFGPRQATVEPEPISAPAPVPPPESEPISAPAPVPPPAPEHSLDFDLAPMQLPAPEARTPARAVPLEPVPKSPAVKLGIVVVTVVSIAIILFTLLVVAGFFREGRSNPKAAPAAPVPVRTT